MKLNISYLSQLYALAYLDVYFFAFNSIFLFFSLIDYLFYFFLPYYLLFTETQKFVLYLNLGGFHAQGSSISIGDRKKCGH